MKENRVCQYCNKLFRNIEGRVFSNHVRWCPDNKNNGDKGRKNIKNSLKNKYENINGEIIEFNVLCNKCKKEFIIKEPKKKFPKKEKYYCCRSCANSRKWTKDINQKRSLSNFKSSRKKYQKPILIKLKTFKKEIKDRFKITYPNGIFEGKIKNQKEELIKNIPSDNFIIHIKYDGSWYFKMSCKNQ